MKLQEIPINKIKITDNHRTNVQATRLEELMQSIKHQGLKQPIGVAKKGRGGYVLRFGQRRLLACKKLGYKTIAAAVTELEDNKQLMLENLTENMQRSDPSFAEFGYMIHKLTNKMDLSLKEVAVNLGIPLPKIKQIVDVYESLPEKYRKKVYFMEKGGGRKARKGCIPAQAATKIASLKREHNLDHKSLDRIFKATVEDGMDLLDLNNASELISSGMDVEAALLNVRAYRVFTVDVVIKHTDLSELMEKYGLLNRSHLFKKIMYGELPPLQKPSFVNTGVCLSVKKSKKVDNSPFKKMRDELIKRSRTGKLTQEQKAALKSTNKIPAGEWTTGQCEQIKNILEDTK